MCLRLICLFALLLTLVACSRAPHDSEPVVDQHTRGAQSLPPSAPVKHTSDSLPKTATTPLPVRGVYLCGWHPHPPKQRVILADIFLSRFTPDTPATHTELESVRALGGEVRYVFHVPIVRARIERDRVPSLVESGLARMVATVSDPERRDIAPRIFFTRPAQGSDADRVAQLGGSVEWRPDPINDGRAMMEALVPDSAVPYIRAIPGFDHIEVGSACVRGV